MDTSNKYSTDALGTLEMKLLVDGGGFVPIRSSTGSIGFDLFSPEAVTVKQNEIVKVNLNVRVELPTGYGGLLFMRSSVAARGGVVLAHVIDTDYRGPLIACISNMNSDPLQILVGERFIQLVPVKVMEGDVKTVQELSQTARGEGGFGHTGK